MKLIPATCPRCWGHGQRGMDFCHTCDGTGSVFNVAGELFPNTKDGFFAAEHAIHNSLDAIE